MDDGEWHNLQIIIDTDANQLQFVCDKTAVVARKFTFRAGVDQLTEFFFMNNSTRAPDQFYVDTVAKTITMDEATAEG